MDSFEIKPLNLINMGKKEDFHSKGLHVFLIQVILNNENVNLSRVHL